jgi:predicted nicotinamide N-methyase
VTCRRQRRTITPRRESLNSPDIDIRAEMLDFGSLALPVNIAIFAAGASMVWIAGVKLTT